ncbi:hypothetical protein Sru01_13750 [Sphaerisporangium rufum]|uniref:Uncharacterized protein n=1 Tax=Sphaerisporangium rufum TaxID=1381558 RepID=A0A919V079_9ACTN|nr:hypothetical protein [Sphaerisporangium rufum]GII76393.1 hypothetical protein Sru01_13750 [Sphaerisporangium rufum]
MTAVIIGLVAVVLLVLAVVVIGMRSMSRRESNLAPERLRKMAEQADAPSAKRGRPAEETFFRSFPEGFDAFQEPERVTARLRPGGNRPAARPGAKPGGRSGPRAKQGSSSRGRRGVDEWGDADDYDDDYWTRVRADDGAFGGTIAARMGVSRPDLATGAGQEPDRPAADPDAATVQAPLPVRPGGLADLVEPVPGTTSAAAAADERTVTFSAPVPRPPAAETPGTVQPPARGRRPARPEVAEPDRTAGAGRPRSRRRAETAEPGRPAPGRGSDTRRGEGRRAGRGADTVPGAARPEGARADAGRGVTGRPSGPIADPLNTGPVPGPAGRAGAPPARGSGRRPAGTGPAEAPRTTGPLDSGRPHDASRPASRATGPARAAAAGGHRDVPDGGPPTGDFPTRPGYPASYQATGSYDILDEPPGPAQNTGPWPTSGYQLPTYGEPVARPDDPSYPAPSATSYEVTPGWATIDDGDAAPATGPSPAGQAGYPEREPAPGSWPAPRERTTGGWPTYSELYGNGVGSDQAPTPSRGGHHRSADPDYPDSYR